MRAALLRRPAVRTGVVVAAAALAVPALASYPSSVAAADPGASPSGAPAPRFTATGLTPTDTVTAGKASTSGLAGTPEALKHLTSPAPVSVMIKYDYDALASYTGTTRGYAATSPSVVGGTVSTTSGAATSYLGLVRSRQSTIDAQVLEAAPAAWITQGFQVGYGGVSAVVPGNRIPAILAVPGVVAVQRDTVRRPQDSDSADFIDSGKAYAALAGSARSGRRTAGHGLLLGNIDTGVWPEHPEFSARPDLPAYTGPALACDFGDNPLTPASDPFACNNKLVGGRAFLATYPGQQRGPRLLRRP